MNCSSDAIETEYSVVVFFFLSFFCCCKYHDQKLLEEARVYLTRVLIYHYYGKSEQVLKDRNLEAETVEEGYSLA